MEPPSSPGRRDNGLQSADWGALVDLDPRLSEALLTSLASADVPAFVEPAGGSDAWHRATQLPDRPLHRLWVDPTKADTARSVVAAEVADLSALLAEHDPGATAHGFVQAVPRTAAVRVLRPPVLPDPPSRRSPATPGSDPRSEAGPATASPATPSPATPSPVTPSSPTPSPPAPSPAVPSSAAPSPETRDTPTGDAPSGPPTSGAGAEGGGAPDTGAGQGGAVDDEEAWRQIIASFGKDDDNPVPPWPVVEDVEPRRSRVRPPRPERSGDDPPRRRRTDPPPDPAPALPGWVEPEAVEDDGHYVPPPPPPVPRLAPRKLAAAAVLLLGLLLMLAPAALLQSRTVGTGLFGVLLTVGGAAALIWLMRDSPPGDSGPDDGAVV